MSAGYQDEIDRFLIELRKRRSEIGARIMKGDAKPDNIIGGYYHEVGSLRGMEIAEEVFRGIFVDFLPPLAEQYAERKIVTEY